jgi:SAM-dependent methyltransferase
MAIDGKAIPFENHFDIVLFKSILGGIGRNGDTESRRKVISEIHKSLKPGGKLLFAENLGASRAHKFLRKRLTSWGSYWNYLEMEEVGELFNQYDSLIYDTAGFLGHLAGMNFSENCSVKSTPDF